MSQVKALALSVITAVKAYVAQSVAGVETRLDQFETQIRAIPAPLKGDPGEPGKSVTIEDIHPLLTAAVAALPIPKDGKSVTLAEVEPLVVAAVAALPAPKDGKSVTIADVEPLVAAAVSALPKPKDGRNAFEIAVSLGFEGDVYAWQESLCGKGKDGASVTVEQVLPTLQAELQKTIAALPVPKNGNDSQVTAEDFRTLFEAESAKALLDFERRAQDVLLKAISNIPAPKDGADGLGFDDLEVIHDGERQITLKFVRGDVVKEFPLIVPALIDRGVYRPGQAYEKGDCVSYGGSIWIAQKDTESKPEIDDSWRLSVKRGRDGKGEKGDRGDPGEPGKPGRDLTQIGNDGSKW